MTVERDVVQAGADQWLDTLQDWVRIPSVSADPAHHTDVAASAQFLADQLRSNGFPEVRVLDEGPWLPAVLAHWPSGDPDAVRVVVYGHHDVQPADPMELWHTPPFDPEIRDGQCFARGAIDDKGQVLYELEAVRGLLHLDGRLAVNVKFLVEGEEEIGSPNFEGLLTAERDRLACDMVVVSDTGMLAVDVPSTTVGMRGLVAFTISVRSAAGDLHSGMFGGAVPNAARVVAELAAALHGAAGQVDIPGFYDDVAELSEVEAASLDAVPFDAQAWMRQAGVTALTGEQDRSVLERVGTRPTAEIVGLGGGYSGAGMKTIVPATAQFKVAFRLVPNQDPDRIATAFGAWLDAHTPAGCSISIEREGGVRPALTPVGHPGMGALCRVIERIWGIAPLFVREGGSGPEEALGRVLDAPVLFLGVGLPDDRIHAPNERMVMDQFWKGLLAAGELWSELAVACSLDAGAST